MSLSKRHSVLPLFIIVDRVVPRIFSDRGISKDTASEEKFAVQFEDGNSEARLNFSLIFTPAETPTNDEVIT